MSTGIFSVHFKTSSGKRSCLYYTAYGKQCLYKFFNIIINYSNYYGNVLLQKSIVMSYSILSEMFRCVWLTKYLKKLIAMFCTGKDSETTENLIEKSAI